MAFVALFCRSHYSPLGVASPTLLARRARALGLGTLGLCDEATIGGFLEFEDECRREGIRPIFGCRLPMQGLVVAGATFPIDFLIESEQGYRNLVRLLTIHHQAGSGAQRALAPIDLKGRAQGLAAIVPPDGELAALIAARDRERGEDYLKQALELFGAALNFGAATPSAKDAESVFLATMTMRLARFIGARPLAAPPVHYPEPGDAAAAAFLATPGQAPGRAWKASDDATRLPCLMTEDEFIAPWQGELEDLPHEAGNVARRCPWRPVRMRRVFPTLDLERGFDPNSYLFDLVIRGATQRYGEITEPLKQRINKEFEDVRADGLAPWLLLNQQIAQALDERGISRGVGRGRLVSSVLAYCLNISRIDPLAYSLTPRRLMVEGEAVPPVMVEIPRATVPELLAWLRDTFGDDHLAEIGRVQELRRDLMISELAAWAGMTPEERRLARREKARLRTAGAAQRLGELAEGHKSRRWRDPAFLGDLAARLSPRPRGWIGTSDRYVLSADPLEAVVPRIAGQQGRTVTGLEESAIDRLGLARIQFTPHSLLDVLDHAMRAARAQQPGLDFDRLPLDDRATFELIARGDTAGIPPLENPTTRALLRKHQPAALTQLLRVKTDADNAVLRARGGGERPRDSSDALPDVLLSYQCAWLKANFPLAFHSAALSAAIEQRQNPRALVRAARRNRFQVLPPDINLSGWGASLHAGQIRLGLASVKGLGPRAWENISSVREGGNFTSLESLCERIELKELSLRQLRALVAAGALDSLGPNRATMDHMLQRLQKRSRDRDDDDEGRQPSFLDTVEPEPEEEPGGEPPMVDELPEWNDFDRLAREAEALGFPLGEDPIDRFRIVGEHLRPLQVEQLPARGWGRPLRVAGLVCSTDTAGSLFENAEDTLVDLEGLTVLLPGAVARLAEPCLQVGCEVLIIGTLERDAGFPYLRADGIWRLEDLEQQATSVALVRLQLAGENRHTLKLLIELAKQYPGNTKLQLMQYPGRMGWTWRRLSRLSVFFCSPFYQGLCKILPPEAVELYNQGGDLLLVKTSAPDGDEDDSGGDEASGGDA